MKNFYYLALLVLTLGVFRPCISDGQEITDLGTVLQKCIDLPMIQSNYPADNSGNFLPVHIMQYPVTIPVDVNLKKFGQLPVFMSRHEIYDNNVDAYFLFKKIDISPGFAYVDYTMYYDYNSEEQKVINISLTLNSINDNTWEIVDLVFENK